MHWLPSAQSFASHPAVPAATRFAPQVTVDSDLVCELPTPLSLQLHPHPQPRREFDLTRLYIIKLPPCMTRRQNIARPLLCIICIDGKQCENTGLTRYIYPRREFCFCGNVCNKIFFAQMLRPRSTHKADIKRFSKAGITAY